MAQACEAIAASVRDDLPKGWPTRSGRHRRRSPRCEGFQPHGGGHVQLSRYRGRPGARAYGQGPCGADSPGARPV